MAKQTMTEFIKANKTDLFNRIFRLHKDLVGKVKEMNKREIRIMVINEPELLKFAREQGVVIATQRCEIA
jgi:hypothetical protein